jgi:hypothetical protein
MYIYTQASMQSLYSPITHVSFTATDDSNNQLAFSRLFLKLPNISVGIATDYGLDDPGSIPGSTRFFSSPQRPDRLWSTSIHLPNGYPALLPRGLGGRAVKLPTHRHLVLNSRMVELYLHSLICLHGIVLN